MTFIQPILLLLLNEVSAIEGLTPNAQLIAKLVLGILAVVLVLFLQSRKPPEGIQPPKP